MDLNKWYWISEYMKVFLGYMFLMFLWPSVVFKGYLRGKSKLFRFSFCVTVPIVIMNTLILVLGLLHILDQRIVCLLLYGVFGLAFLKNIINYFNQKYRSMVEAEFADVRILKGKYRRLVLVLLFFVVFCRYVKKAVRFLCFDYNKKINSINRIKIRLRIKDCLLDSRRRIHFYLGKYGILMFVIIYGMVYLSYGAFQVNSYGYGDLYTHHRWVYGLIEGNIFIDGIYPAAMHCFIYCMHTLLGIRVYSIMLYLQIIHVGIIFLAAYFLMRKIFSWRYTPEFVLMLFFTLDLCNADLIHSMFRLQITMPQEFGMHAVFLCALYLKNYLDRDKTNIIGKKEKILKFFEDENLLLFTVSVSVVVMVHFHAALMALIMCVSFALFSLKKIFNKNYLIPLMLAVFSAGVISITPMLGAMMQGTPFSTPIYWAVYAASGDESRGFREEKTDESERKDTTEEIGEEGYLWKLRQYEPAIITSIRNKVTKIYNNGYIALYGKERGSWMFALTVVAVICCCLAKWKGKFKFLHEVCLNYPPAIAVSVIYTCAYAAPMLGLPDIIPEGRFFVPGHMMLLAVTVMPVDILFSNLVNLCKDIILMIFSLATIIGIYIVTIVTGSFRGFLFYELSRYNAVAEVTESIIDTFPRNSYTIVSPTDEIYPLIQYGWHEELLTFAEKCRNAGYSIPSEYVFIFVEKKPLLHTQPHFFTGSSWMGAEKYLEPFWDMYAPKYPNSTVSQSPEIIVSQIYEEEAEKELPVYENAWSMYLQLEKRTILESIVYDWCQSFAKEYPSALHVYYEDDAFVCYYVRQDIGNQPYELGLEPVD